MYIMPIIIRIKLNSNNIRIKQQHDMFIDFILRVKYLSRSVNLIMNLITSFFLIVCKLQPEWNMDQLWQDAYLYHSI